MTEVLTDAETLLRRADELAPVLRERGPEAEALRKMPDATIADFETAGLLGAMRPGEVGGTEISLGELLDITRRLSRGDASAGWIGSFLISHSWLLTKLDQEAQEEIFGDRTWVAAAAAASPPGRAEKVPGGYRVSGRWRFASGVMHSEWVVGMAISDTGPLSVVLPLTKTTVHDTWFTPGMKGTGSNDVEAVDVFVPDPRAVSLDVFADPDCPGASLYSYPMVRYPMHRVLPLIHPAVAIGTADAALELFREAVDTRTRIQTRGAVADEWGTQEVYGRAYQKVRSAALVLDDAVGILVSAFGPEATPMSLQRRADLNLAVTAAGIEAFEAIDLIIQASGASIHRTGHPLERICRDTQVMRNHGIMDWRYTAATAGRALLGRGLGDHAEALF